MEFDVRDERFTFKHEITSQPELTSNRFPDHYHSVYELLYCIQGDADFMIQHTRYTLHPHSLLVVKPGQHHQIVLKSSETYDRIVIRFDENNMHGKLRRQLRNLDSVYLIKDTKLSEELLRMDEMYQNIHRDLIYNAFIGELYVILARLLSSRELIQEADEVNEDFRMIIDFIDGHLTEITTIEDLCRSLHMSRSTIQKIFSDQLHTPIMSYIRVQKIMLAHTMLHDGINANETAIQCGFRDYSSFYRAYMKIYKHAPVNDYRKI